MPEETSEETARPIPVAAMEEGLLILLATNQDHAMNVAEQLQNYKFEVSGAQRIFETCALHIADPTSGYQVPGFALLDSLLNAGHGSVERKLLDHLKELFANNFQASFYLEKLQGHLRLYELDRKFADATEALRQRNLQRAEELLFEIGEGTTAPFAAEDLTNPCVLFDYLREEAPGERFHGPIPLLEEQYFFHPRRGFVMTICAGPGGCKSTAMTEIIRLNVQRKRILFFSLERGDQYKSRFVQSHFCMVKRGAAVISVPHLVKTGNTISVNYTERRAEGVQDNQQRILDVVNGQGIWANLRVYQRPQGTLTFSQIRKTVLQLRRTGFDTDMLVLDYLDRMKISKNPEHLRIETVRLANEISSLAGELNIAVVTGSQLNHEGVNKKIAGLFDMAEAPMGKAAAGDQVLILGSDEESKRNKIMFAKIVKQRGEPGDVLVLLAQQLETAQFCLDAVEMGQGDKIALASGQEEGEELSLRDRIIQLLQERRWSINTIVARCGTTRTYVMQISREVYPDEHEANAQRTDPVRVN